MKSKKGIGLITLIVIIVSILLAGGVTVFFITKTLHNENNIQGTNNVDLNENKAESSKIEVPDEYIGIYTAEDLLKFNTQEFALDGKYILMNNIDLSSIKEFTPIGHHEGFTYPKEFTGIFDGNYYTISNLNLKSSKELQGDIGLFAEIEAGIVRNLNIKNANVIIEEVPNSATDIGILSGLINNSLIENCNFSDIKFEINGTEQLGSIGTIAGQIEGHADYFNTQRYEGYEEKDENSNPEVMVVRNINVDVALTGNHVSEFTEFGGAFGITSTDYGLRIKAENIIVNLKSDNEYISTSGFVSLGVGIEIEKCGTTVDINSKNADNVAGFINSLQKSIIDQCYSKGNITAKEYISGFVGGTYKGTMGMSGAGITNSYSTVNIIATSDSKYPCIANFMRNNESTLENIYASGTISHIDGKEIDKAFVYDTISDITKNAYHNINEINDIDNIIGIEAYREKYPNTLVGLTEEEMKIKSSYIGFDFENIWAIDDGESTPYLKFENK